MEKLKKLTLSKYLNICNKNTFLELINNQKIDCQVKKINNNQIIFLTNKKITIDEVESLNRIKYHLKYTFSKHLSGIISIFLSIIILFGCGSFVREISFTDNTKYNEAIYQDVKKHLIKKGPFYVLDKTANEISSELRQEYPEYAWIGIRLNYNKVLIDVEYQDVPPKIENNKKITGDLVSKYDGIIEGMVIKKGVVLVVPNQSVKKGDVLVSGNLKVELDPLDTSDLVKAEGIVIGKTLVLEKIKVPKVTSNLEYTGNVKQVKVWSIFGKMIGKNPVAYDNYYTDVSIIFNFFNILSLVKISYYEQQVVEKVYDEKSAIKYAESKIYYELEKNRSSEHERIDELKILSIDSLAEYYEISFIVAKHVNFVTFRQH